MPAKPISPPFSPLQARAEALANPAFFTQLGQGGDVFFAVLPAGLEQSHQLVFDAGKNIAQCSCPFFPKPCLHLLAFTQLVRQAPDSFPPAALPEWTSALLPGQSRIKTPTDTTATRARGVEKRRFERLERAAHGLDDLEAWLFDTLRRGVATAVSEERQFGEGIAGRAADASLGAISRRLRQLDQQTQIQPDWGHQALETLAEIYLAVRAFRQREQLPEALLYDLESFLGLAARKDEVISAGERVADTWAVLGCREEPLENQLQLRRTWLLGARSGRQALLLDHAFGYSAGFPPGFSPGDIVSGTLVFYPSAYPLRALVLDDLATSPKKVEKWPGFADFQAFATAYAAALGAQPWLGLFPAAFPALTPGRSENGFFLADARGQSLPLEGLADNGWKLLALSGGRPLGVFGEWNGKALRVLSVVAEGRMVVI